MKKFIGNILKLIGITMIVLSIVHAFGLYEFPSPAGLSKTNELFIACAAGVYLAVFTIEEIKEHFRRLLSIFIKNKSTNQ